MHFVEAKGLLSAKNGMNLYRGCTHGCIYCDSRSVCYHFTHPFEDVEVKQNAPALLEQALKSKRKKCMIGTGSMSDPYQPCECELKLTRRCLELIERYGFGATVITKSDLILRDLDLWGSIARKTKAVVQMTLTTMDEDLCRIVEPNVCTTARRVEVLKILKENGIPSVVWLTPILPFLNDTPENLNGLLNACEETGIRGVVSFGMGLTLREGDREYFYAALDRYFPGMRRRYVSRYGNAYELESDRAWELNTILRQRCRVSGILSDPGEVFSYLSEFPEETGAEQLTLF